MKQPIKIPRYKWAVAQKGKTYILAGCMTEEEADERIKNKPWLEKRRILG